MKKVWLYLVGLVLIAAAAGGILLAKDNSSDHAEKTAETGSATSTNSNSKDACQIFSLADAKQVLGATAKGGANNGGASSDDLKVSTCTYSQAASGGVPVSTSNSASLLARAPKTGAGATGNQNQFGSLKPANVQAVGGYGDSAYWDPEFGQLNILKNNTWYILSNGPLTPSARTLEQAKQLADILISKM